MLERRLYSIIDWWLLIAIVAVSAIGMMMIYSTTYDETSQLVSNKLMTQGYALIVGLIAFSFFMLVNWIKTSSKSLSCVFISSKVILRLSNFSNIFFSFV